eukprot:GHVT01069272.1.p1 GENE.GHVT01069272.1~~GHVT01069272.1.p1  ORF type:complete len:243 (-),score=65.16 GHVT01069272.1:867-1595(-)
MGGRVVGSGLGPRRWLSGLSVAFFLLLLGARPRRLPPCGSCEFSAARGQLSLLPAVSFAAAGGMGKLKDAFSIPKITIVFGKQLLVVPRHMKIPRFMTKFSIGSFSFRANDGNEIFVNLERDKSISLWTKASSPDGHDAEFIPFAGALPHKLLDLAAFSSRAEELTNQILQTIQNAERTLAQLREPEEQIRKQLALVNIELARLQALLKENLSNKHTVQETIRKAKKDLKNAEASIVLNNFQ